MGLVYSFLLPLILWGGLLIQKPINQLNPNDTSSTRIYNGTIINKDFHIDQFDRIEKLTNKEDLKSLGFNSVNSILIVQYELYPIEYKIDSILYNRPDFITNYKFPLNIQLPLSINNKLLSHQDKKEKLRDLTLKRIKKIEYI